MVENCRWSFGGLHRLHRSRGLKHPRHPLAPPLSSIMRSSKYKKKNSKIKKKLED